MAKKNIIHEPVFEVKGVASANGNPVPTKYQAFITVTRANGEKRII